MVPEEAVVRQVQPVKRGVKFADGFQAVLVGTIGLVQKLAHTQVVSNVTHVYACNEASLDVNLQ